MSSQIPEKWTAQRTF